MSTRRHTFQYKETISINRDLFLNVVVRNDNLNKKALRVLLHLLTYLDATTYKEVSKKQLALDLDLNKSDVSDAIETLMYEGIICEGSSPHISKGYKLLF